MNEVLTQLPGRASAAIEPLLAGDRRATPYFTDGVVLYRFLGPSGDGNGEMVAIEDCLTLEVLLLSVDELRVAELTAVVPDRQTPAQEDVRE